jgi:hypothetical protein
MTINLKHGVKSREQKYTFIYFVLLQKILNCTKIKIVKFDM